MSITAPDPWINELSAYFYAYDRDTPAKTWSEAPIYHPAIGRHLRIDRAEDGGVFALAPFRVAMIENQHRILAAWPAPRILTSDPDDHLGIDTVIAWNPIDDTASVLGDPVPQLVGRFPDAETGAIFASPRAYFQAWAMARAAFFVRWRDAMRKPWSAAPTETDMIPGTLLIGEPEAIRWNPSALPASITVQGIDPARVNKAIFKAARLPRVSRDLRAVA